MGVALEVDDVQWPDEGMVPPEFTEHMLLKAAVSFPDHTGLSWDSVHPRVLTRVSKPLLKWIVVVLVQCEIAGL